MAANHEKQRFFIQAAYREVWHCESEDDCEVMLCGKRISVDSRSARIQYRWGPRKCIECFIEFNKLGW